MSCAPKNTGKINTKGGAVGASAAGFYMKILHQRKLLPALLKGNFTTIKEAT